MRTDRPDAVQPSDSPSAVATEKCFVDWRERVEQRLSDALDSTPDAPERLCAAMRYAVLGGGKRLRPLLVYAAGQACGAPAEALDAPAAAVEMIHAYSLIHDDLPAMDDDALRRGRPTLHIAFDEATAILAGDALQSLAFTLLADAHADAALRLAWISHLGHASGVSGMCGGQALDMQAASSPHAGHEHLQHLHALKTGALIRASVAMGARAGTEDINRLKQLDDFAASLGLAFQIRDDILDIEGSSQQLGKTAGKDAAQDKLTYPALLGMAGAKAQLAHHADRMQTILTAFDHRADSLRQLAALTVHRAY